MKPIAASLFLLCLLEIAYVYDVYSSDVLCELELEFSHQTPEVAGQLAQLYEASLVVYSLNADLDKVVRAADFMLAYGEHYQASRVYYNILQIESDLERAWQGFAMSLDSLGNVEGAITAYHRAASYKDAHPMYKHRAGELELVLGHTMVALEIFQRNESYLPSVYRIVRVLLAEERYD